jgi:ribose transport system ATP-binding protein
MPIAHATTDRSPRKAPLLRLEGVSKSFPGVQALSNVRLDLQHGEVLALVGENGAGKSTLMKLLSGIYEADNGEFEIEGERVDVSSPRIAQGLGISVIHQEFNLMNDLSIAENIFIGREKRVAGIFTSDREINRRTTELLERVHLPIDPRTKVGSLTVAQQQMVEIAKSLSFGARILIMDEPTAALNDAEVATLHDLIRRFITPETGVIYVSHRMDEIAKISNRITVLRDGQYIDTVPTASTPIATVITLMVGRAIATQDAHRSVPVEVTSEPILRVSGLGTSALLRDVSFDLRRGEILGFAGLMGAGRTEVARAIVGADRAKTGTVLLRGEQVQISNPADAARLGIGYLSEDRKRYGLVLDRDVSSNITLSSLARYINPIGFMRDESLRKSSREYVARLRIKTPSISQLTKNLSGGNQQKVVIAKWLLKDCDVLIFDEPTRGIDVGAKEEIYDLLNTLVADGKSIIMISSELPEVLRMSDRIAVMCEGRMTAVLDRADASQEQIMHYATQFGS